MLYSRYRLNMALLQKDNASSPNTTEALKGLAPLIGQHFGGLKIGLGLTRAQGGEKHLNVGTCRIKLHCIGCH